MVDVTDGSDVHVGLIAVKLLFRHCLKASSKQTITNNLGTNVLDVSNDFDQCCVGQSSPPVPQQLEGH